VLTVSFLIVFSFLFYGKRPLGIFVAEKLKNGALKIVRKAKSFVYYEAQIHNPQGDVLPDTLDDKLIQSIKKRVE